jgi:hypothetical protein
MSGDNERLLSMESAIRDMSAQTGKLVGQQEILNDIVSKGFEELRQGQKSLIQKDIDTDNRIKPLEEAAAKREAARAARVSVAKKLALASLVASAGVFGTVAGDKVVAFLGAFFGR